MNTYNPKIVLSDTEVQALADTHGWSYQIDDGKGSMIVNPQSPKDFVAELFSMVLKDLVSPVVVASIKSDGEAQKISLFTQLKQIDDSTAVAIVDAVKALDGRIAVDSNAVIAPK